MTHYITKNEIQQSYYTIYVFGDNLERKGLGGQASIARPFVTCGKAIGIPTKRKPTMEPDAFFSDKNDEIEAVNQSFLEIESKQNQGYHIIFFPNIGAGLAELSRRSPKIHALIQQFIANFEFKYQKH